MQISVAAPSKADADAFIVGVIMKDKKRSAPGLKVIGEADNTQANWLVDSKATALGFKQVQSVPAKNHQAAVVLVGLGDPGQLTQEKLGTALSVALKHVKALGMQRPATTLLADSSMPPAEATQALVHGAIIGELAFDQYKSKKEDAAKAELSTVQILSASVAGTKRVAEKAAIVAAAVNDARLLANTPANIATPAWLAEEARKRGRKHGFKVAVKSRAQLRKEGYNALCAVGQGSVNEECLITMDYAPAGAKKTIVVVGKGVCFDSGGISLKPGDKMWDMKYDKCGACNAIALMTTLKALGVKHRVVGIVAAVENMPSGTAQRPGDIITAKDGTTIEVLNTDAEGRLILADALAHGRTFKPTWMCDMATLTGACDYAIGPTFVAVTSKHDALAESIVKAASAAGDKAWRLPQGEEFDEANKGTYADIQNISLTNRAGTAIGGSFVGHFAKDTPFFHLDIASKAWTAGVDYFAKGPTGAGLRIVLRRILDER